MSSIWGIIAIPLGWIMKYCYIFAHDIIGLDGLAYVLALFLFTLITKVLMFPLSIKQQRMTAMTAAYKPMMDEIQKKYANDKRRQQEEMSKLQQEYGINPLAGCLPLLVQFPIIFGLIEVIYSPLTYMLRIGSDVLAPIKELTTTIMGELGVTLSNTRLLESNVIKYVQDPAYTARFTQLASGNSAMQSALNTIGDFKMSLGPIQLYETPSIKEFGWIWIIPVISIVTMLFSQLINSKLSGQRASGGNQMTVTIVMMSVLFAVFSFMYPAGFSLYWSMSNVCIILQSLILHKMIDPDKLAEEFRAKAEEKKKAKKKVVQKTVKLKDDSGEIVEKTVSNTELDKLRLQRAREIDAERYDD